ncbi:MAG: hypothetical protein PHS57_10440 [Alphaproteobacteria bacterium]|nr:hypothetical protein [Alphaproteobacteria bacterium]
MVSLIFIDVVLRSFANVLEGGRNDVVGPVKRMTVGALARTIRSFRDEKIGPRVGSGDLTRKL